MSIKVTDLANSDLLEDLNIADSSAVIGGRHRSYSPRPFFPAPGTATGGSIVNISGNGGTAIGFGAASGSGFTAASSNAEISGGGGSASGGGFTGGISGIIDGTFNRV